MSVGIAKWRCSRAHSSGCDGQRHLVPVRKLLALADEGVAHIFDIVGSYHGGQTKAPGISAFRISYRSLSIGMCYTHLRSKPIEISSQHDRPGGIQVQLTDEACQSAQHLCALKDLTHSTRFAQDPG